MRPLSSAKFSGPRGFTLVELLVAMAVAALVLVSLASIVTGATTLSRRNADSLVSYNAAASALNIIGTDLESLVSNPGAFEFLVYTNQTVGPHVTNAGLLIFLTSSPTDLPTEAGNPSLLTNAGQARAVIYRLAYQDAASAVGTNRVYGLYRTVVTNTADVFARWFTNNLTTVTNLPPSPPLDDFLAENVVDFRVRFFPQATNVPLNANGSDTLSIRGDGVLVNSATNTNGLATAEITMTVLDEAIVRQRLRDGSISPSDFESLRQTNGRTLTRRVHLRLPY